MIGLLATAGYKYLDNGNIINIFHGDIKQAHRRRSNASAYLILNTEDISINVFYTHRSPVIINSDV